MFGTVCFCHSAFYLPLARFCALFVFLFSSVSFYCPYYTPLLSPFSPLKLRAANINSGLCCVCVCALPGSSSFESQKMDRPSISVTSPMSPSMLRDAPQYLSGQLSVSDLNLTCGVYVKAWKGTGLLEKFNHFEIV